MRALVLTGPGQASVEEVDRPIAGPGEVVVEVERVGLCGTDVEFFTGEMAYLHQGHASYPLRIGHEWVGRVVEAAGDVDSSWVGRRVTSDTMLGCGVCARCLSGRHHVCDDREEIGIRAGRPGALAEQIPVPVRALHQVPDSLSAEAAALVEPGANAVRVVEAGGIEPGSRVLVFGPGTIGLLVARFAIARGGDVQMVGLEGRSLELARAMGMPASVAPDLQPAKYDIVVDASTDAGTPTAALGWVEPGGRVILIGLAGSPSLVDTREVVLGDLTVVGVLGGSAGIPEAIAAYSRGEVVPDPLVAEVVSLDDVGSRLAGERGPLAGPGPKVQVDPRL